MSRRIAPKSATRTTALAVAPRTSANLAKRSTTALARTSQAMPLARDDRRGTTVRTEPLRKHEGRILYAAGEPMARRTIAGKRGRPQSLWSAIVYCDREWWQRFALEALGMTRAADREQVMADCLVYDAQHTNKVDVFRDASVTIVQWSVWIDPKGSFKLEVWP